MSPYRFGTFIAFKPLFSPPTDAGALEQRITLAVESLLDNESLTADLTDEPANVLLEWGRALTRQVITPTAGLDPAAAEAALEPQLKALRRLLRQVGQWAAQWPAADPVAPETQTEHLDKVLEQAAVVYGAINHGGPTWSPPASEGRQAFLGQLAPTSTPTEVIQTLRQWLEGAAQPPTTTPTAAPATETAPPTETTDTNAVTPGDSNDQEAYF